MVSSINADPNHPGDDTFSVYLRAKGEADAELAASGLDYTIVRPGPLTNDPGTGRVALGRRARRRPARRRRRRARRRAARAGHDRPDLRAHRRRHAHRPSALMGAVHRRRPDGSWEGVAPREYLDGLPEARADRPRPSLPRALLRGPRRAAHRARAAPARSRRRHPDAAARSVTLGDEQHELGPGDVVYVAPGRAALLRGARRRAARLHLRRPAGRARRLSAAPGTQSRTCRRRMLRLELGE